MALTHWERRGEAIIPGTEEMTRDEAAARGALMLTVAYARAQHGRLEAESDRYLQMERTWQARWGLEWREVAEKCEEEVAAWVMERRLDGAGEQVGVEGLLKRS